MPVKAKYIKDLPLKRVLDGSESLLVQDLNGTQQAPLGTIVDEIKQNSQEKIREIKSELAQTNAQLSTKASEQALAIERARIDSFTKLNEGSTTGDAELIDARVGSDGVVYPNLGDSIRTQINDSNNRTKQLSDLLTVGLDFKITERQGYLKENGSYGNDPNLHCKVTDKIYCEEGWVFSYTGHGSAHAVSWLFYNGNVIVGSGQYHGAKEVVIPAGVNGVVFSSYDGVTANVSLSVELLEPIFVNKSNLIKNLNNKIGVNELDSYIKNTLSYKKNFIDPSDMEEIQGYYASFEGTLTSHDVYSVYELNVSGGEVYSYRGKVVWHLAPYHLIDEKGNVVVIGGDNEIHDEVVLVDIEDLIIPHGVVKLRVCSGDEGGKTSFALYRKTGETPTTKDDVKKIVDNHIFSDLGALVDITDRYDLVEGYYIASNGGLVADNNSQYIDYIDLTELDVVYIDAHSQYSTCTMAIYDVFKKKLAVLGYAKEEGETVWNKHRLVVSEILEQYPLARYIRIGTFMPAKYPIAIYEKKSTLKQIIVDLEERVNRSNILHGKKYVACGDSFTEGDFDGYVDEDGLSGKNSPKLYDKNRKMYKTYPWWIAERNNMELINEAKCGSVITNAFDGQKNPFSINRYLQVPTDADYITLMFGLNETDLTTEQIGTKTDTTNTTLWGAYNIVFEHFLTNMPYAKIGVIIADAWMNTKYANAVKEICAYWGIPVLDLKFDPNVTMGIGGRPNGSPKAQQLRNLAFQVTPSNSHPNVEAHEYRSTIIEHFLRSL